MVMALARPHRVLIGFALLIRGAHAASHADIEFFETRIRPILSKNCYSCHTQSAMGGLRVDSRESLLRGGKSGPAIVPGKIDDSLLLKAVRHQSPALKMPPPGKLREAEIA